MHILGAFLDIPAKYEVSVINTLTRTDVHIRRICQRRQDHDCILGRNHDYIGSFACMPNKPKSDCLPTDQLELYCFCVTASGKYMNMSITQCSYV